MTEIPKHPICTKQPFLAIPDQAYSKGAKVLSSNRFFDPSWDFSLSVDRNIDPNSLNLKFLLPRLTCNTPPPANAVRMVAMGQTGVMGRFNFY